MKISQESTPVEPVFIQLDEAEQKLVEERLKSEGKDSVFSKCYSSNKGFAITSDDLDAFWDKLEEILHKINEITPERKMLVEISNTFSTEIQFPKNETGKQSS